MKKDYKIVEISKMIISDNKDDILITYSLGSCLGLILYDPFKCIGGMIHCMLPLSTSGTQKASDAPYMYVDSGLVKMLQELVNKGVNLKNLICKVAGCASPLEEANNMFKTGDRNYAVMKKILWKNNILIKAEHVGGKHARTMLLYMNTGKTVIKLDGKEEFEI